jgi:DHA1 family multidrug resistance protein-like MFS transporter
MEYDPGIGAGQEQADRRAGEDPSTSLRAGLRAPQSDGDPRWRVTLSVMWVAQLCAIMGFSFVMPFIPLFVRELNVPERMVPIWAGLSITGSGIAMSIVSPLWGYVADRRGRKLMVQRAMFGGSVVLALMGLVRNVYELTFLRVIQGAVTGTVSACVALVSSVVPRDRLGFSLGLMQMAVFLGGSVGPYLGGLMADQYGYRVPFGVTGAMLFTGGLLVLLGAKERFTANSGSRGRGPAPARSAVEGARGGEEPAVAIPLRVLLRNRTVLGLLGVYFALNVASSFVGPIFPLFVEQIVGRPQEAAGATGMLLAVSGVASAVSALMVGRLSDRVGHKAMLVSCTVLTGVLIVPHYWAQTLGQLTLLRVALGLSAGGMVPAMNSIVASVVPRSSIGQAYGFTATASALGWSVGPAIGGGAAVVLGYRWPFVIMGALMVLVAVSQQRWIQPDGREQGSGSGG